MTKVQDLDALMGTEVGVSRWFELTQERVNAFADATAHMRGEVQDACTRHLAEPYLSDLIGMVVAPGVPGGAALISPTAAKNFGNSS